MTPIIEEILTNRVTLSAAGEELKLSSEISAKDGRFLHSIISGNSEIKNTLEVGCAFGISSLHICDALQGREGAMHTIIDPFQNQNWKGAGIHALKRAGFDHFKLYEELSEVALPSLLEENEGQYDFIFIDGWHTFDHVMVDCFYANRLLKVGGFLIIDDTNVAAIAKVAKYFASYPCFSRYGSTTNYPNNSFVNVISRMISCIPVSYDLHHRLPRKLQKAIRYPNIIALKKVEDDQRTWHWYKPF